MVRSPRLCLLLGLFTTATMLLFGEAAVHHDAATFAFSSRTMGTAVDYNALIDTAGKACRITRFDNGLTLLHYYKGDTPQVFVEMTCNVGSANEKHGQEGFAHIVEHMLFKGTKKLSETDIQEISEQFGVGQIGEGFNAFTTHDKTVYHFKSDKINWPIFVDILADWLINARFDDEHFASEIQAVFREMKERDADGNTELLSALLPPSHPYHHALIGYKEGLLRATAREVKAFYNEHYKPSNTVLTVVGNVTNNDLLRVVCETFGAIPSNGTAIEDGTRQEQLPFYKDVSTTSKTVYKTVPYSTRACVWRIPGARKDNPYLARFLAYVLHERLHHRLHDVEKCVYAVAVFPHILEHEGLLYVKFIPHATISRGWFAAQKKGEQVLEYVTSLIQAEVDKLQKGGCTCDELERFAAVVKTGFVRSLESCQSIAALIRDGYCAGHTLNPLSAVSRVDGLTLDRFARYVSEYLRPCSMSMITCMPLRNEDHPHWLALQQDVDAYDQALLAHHKREKKLEETRYLTALPTPGSVDFTFEKPDYEFTLSNGLHVFAKQRASLPLVSVRCGFLDANKIRFAHAILHKSFVPGQSMALLAEGSAHYLKRENEEFFDRRGASCEFKRFWWELYVPFK